MEKPINQQKLSVFEFVSSPFEFYFLTSTHYGPEI